MLKALRPFVASVEDRLGMIHSVSFRGGQVIAEPRLEADLLKLGCPVVPVNNAVTVACAKCGAVFDRSLHTTSATATVVDAAIPYGHQFLSYQAGNIIPHFWILEALKAAGVPLEIVTATQCPQCQSVFR